VENQILKVYGLKKSKIEDLLKEITSKYSSQVKISIKEKYIDSTIDISGENDDTIRDVSREILKKLGNNVYADSYQTLYEKLADLLIVRNKKICLFEQGSGGVIASNLLAIENASKHVAESIILPSVDSWLTRFDINPRLISENKGISSKLVFSIASSLRRTCLADYYIVSISSDAVGLDAYRVGEKTENVSLVAIGDASGVEIYKQSLTGDKRDRINQTSKSICYKLICELKK